MKIGIDPGHGMGNRAPGCYDPGAVYRRRGSQYEEATIALAHALTLKAAARARGHQTWLSRSDNLEHCPLLTRDERATAAGCDVLVSLHLNAGPAGARGLEVIWCRGTRSLRLARKLALALRAATGLDGRAEPVKQMQLAAINTFVGAAVLVELGFVTHERDRAFLLEVDGRTTVAGAILDVLERGGF